MTSWGVVLRTSNWLANFVYITCVLGTISFHSHMVDFYAKSKCELTSHLTWILLHSMLHNKKRDVLSYGKRDCGTGVKSYAIFFSSGCESFFAIGWTNARGRYHLWERRGIPFSDPWPKIYYLWHFSDYLPPWVTIFFWRVENPTRTITRDTWPSSLRYMGKKILSLRGQLDEKADAGIWSVCLQSSIFTLIGLSDIKGMSSRARHGSNKIE